MNMTHVREIVHKLSKLTDLENQENTMATFEHGTPVWHPESGAHGVVKKPVIGERFAIMHADPSGIFLSSTDLTGWERARIAGEGEVTIKVDDLDLDYWPKREEYANGPATGAALALRAAKAWSELQTSSSLATSETDSENDTYLDDEQPALITDASGDIWKLGSDGLYRCIDITLLAARSFKEVCDSFGLKDGAQNVSETPETNISAEESKPTELSDGGQPKRVRDRYGDTWTKCDNGLYPMTAFAPGHRTLEALAKIYASLTVLDDEPAQESLSDDGHDAVNHPSHYTSSPATCECGKSIECIQVIEHMGFNLGNAVKYVWRADLKGDALEDLRKAAWYLQREIERRSK